MIYSVTRAFLKIVVHQFYSSFRVRGEARLEEGPLLVVCNHPNFALDSLVVSCAFERPLWFLAKATLFDNPFVGNLLTSLHVIPVHRRQDNPHDMGKNEETFRKAIDILEERKAILIFPEGMSLGERKLFPLKTGVSRIALQAEDGSDFRLGLKIQPVGITYTALQSFQSAVTVAIGQPIQVAQYQESFRKDAISAARELTDEIDRRLRELTVEIQNDQHKELVEKVARLYASSGSALDDHSRFQIVAKNVEALAPKYPERRDVIEKRLDEYLDMLRDLGLTTRESLETPPNAKSDIVFHLLITPFVLLGVITHFVPYRLSAYLSRRFGETHVEAASLKFGFGAVSFLLWYILMAGLSYYLMGDLLYGFVLFVAIVFSGYAVNKYYHYMRLLLLSIFWPGSKSPLTMVRMMRDDLIAELNTLREI